MYIGVGWLFCVTLPAEIRYGIGVRICAPSMPLPSEPSTRLSRVVPHDACLATSTSGMPYLANNPLSLATNSGPASLNAMNPSVALVTSGPAPCANAPAGKFSLAAASKAAVPPVAFRSWRRLKPRREVGLVGFVMGIVVLLRQCVKRGRPIGVTALGAEGRVPGRPRNGGVTIRMSGLEGRLSMASAQAIQASCQASRIAKNLFISIYYRYDATEYRAASGTSYSHSKFAIRSILVRRTRIEQAIKPVPQASSVAFAIIGFGALPSPGFIRNS